MTASLAPLLVVAVVVASDLWVYLDAARCARQGSPVYLHVRTFSVDTPVAWFLACLILWIVFFPMYVASRSRS